MRIRYLGAATVREWTHGETYAWNRENEYVVEVADAEFASELLTHPPGDFGVADDEPMLSVTGIGRKDAAELTLLGIVTLEDLAKLDEDSGARVEAAMGVSGEQVRAWRTEAGALLKQRAEAEMELKIAMELASAQEKSDAEDAS